MDSKGHIEYIGRWEYFWFNDQLYRAPKTNGLDVNGYRMGARWQSLKHLAEYYLETAREWEEQHDQV